MFPVRPLRSTGITPLPHYYGPVRLPRDSSQSPWRTRQLLTPAASASVLGFATFGRLAALTRCNEAELRSLALRLIPSLTQGFAKPDYSDPRLSGYMSNRLFTWWTPLCMCKTRTQASPQSTGQKLTLIRNPSISPLSLLVHYCISAVLLPVCASHSDRLSARDTSISLARSLRSLKALRRRGVKLNPYCTDTLLCRSRDRFVLLSGSSSAPPRLCEGHSTLHYATHSIWRGARIGNRGRWKIVSS